MSLLERDSVLVSTDESGTPIVDLPFTRVNNVEGIGRSANTAYTVGDVVYTDNNMQVALKCTTAGTTSDGELDISGVSVGESVEDGSVVWEVVPRYEEVHKLADYPLRNTSYKLNAVVACPYHAEFLLKCTQAGRTADGALDTTNVTKGQVIEDGGVKWEVIKNFTANDVIPITNGGTGATTANGVRLNLKTRIMSFDSFERLGLDQTTVTLETLYQTFKNVQQTENSSAAMFLMCNISTNTVTGLGLPRNLSGTLFVKHFNDRTQLEFMVDDGLIYTAKYGITTGLMGWNRLCVYEYTKTGNTERYSEGLQICRGTIEVGKTEPEVVNFNLPFVNVGEYQVFLQTISAEEPLTMTATANKLDGSSFKIRSNYDLYGYSWLAIGRWK